MMRHGPVAARGASQLPNLSRPCDPYRSKPAATSLPRSSLLLMPASISPVQQRHLQCSATGSGEPPAPPPFAALSSAVYSLATKDAAGGQRTLNLVTYCSPVSIRPRFYALGLYRGTLSWENMLATGEGALQILGTQHAALFQLLGKQSGRNIDKLVSGGRE